MAIPLGRRAREVSLTPHDHITDVRKTQQQSPAAQPKPRWALRLRSRCGLRHETCRPGTQRLTASQSLADISPPLLPRTQCGLDVCVASSIAAAARGDAAQTAFDRKLTHSEMNSENLRRQNIHYRPPVWTRTGGHIQPSLERFSTQQTSPPVATIL